nr:phage tail tape measure protein [Gemmatimonadota bacterium]
MASVGTAYVDISGDFSSLNKQLGAQMGGSRFGKLGKLAGGAFAGGLVAAGVGKALYEVGQKFDEAYDTIRVGTGATGKNLEGLKKDFKDVVKSVPTDFKSASTAVADLNTRLGLTGKPLQDRAKQFLELSRITKTDVGANIKDVTRAFGDWEVKTKDQGGQLDKFFRAAQSSGATVGELSKQVVQFGAPLRQVGFSLDEATAMFASFEKAGVNTQTMMPGIKMAMKTFFEKGIDPKKGLTQAFKGIQDGSIDASAAIKIFGSRAGGDMIEAVKQGRFNLDDMTRSLVNGSDTIMKAGQDTQSFSEKWLMFKNRVLVWLEPVAMRVFDAMGDAMDALPAIVAKISNAFDGLRGSLTGTGDTTQGVLASMSGAFESARDTVTGVVDVLTAVWAEFGDDFTALLENAVQTLGKVIASMAKILKGLVDFVAGVLTGDWGRAWNGIKAIVGGAWDGIKAIITGAVTQIRTLLGGALEAIGSIMSSAWSSIRGKTADAWNYVEAKILGTIRGARDAIGSVLSGIGSRLDTAWSGIRSAVATAWEYVRDKILGTIRGARDAIGDVLAGIDNRLDTAWASVRGAVGSAWEYVRDKIIGALRGARDGIESILTGISNRVTGAFDKIKDGLGDFAKNIPGMIGEGFKVAANRAIHFLNGIINAINKIPGVPNIGTLKGFARGGVLDEDSAPAFAMGGKVGPAAVHHDQFARGGEIARPMVIVGEEAPCIAEGTLIETEDGQQPIEDVPMGARVWTRNGLREVLWSGLTREMATTFVVETATGAVVVCTPDHRIWSADGDERRNGMGSGDLRGRGMLPDDTPTPRQGARSGACTADDRRGHGLSVLRDRRLGEGPRAGGSRTGTQADVLAGRCSAGG